jgi:Protein of unknown function (DUF3723)
VKNYLDNVYETWSYLLPSDELKRQLDKPTVDMLKSRCPALDRNDFSTLMAAKSQRKLFWRINSNEREQIWNRLLMIPLMIPTLETFRLDIHFITPCVGILKELFDIRNERKHLHESIMESYLGVNQTQGIMKVQTSETEYRNAVDENQGYDRLYQLHLGCMRHVFEVSSANPRKEKDTKESIQPKPQNLDLMNGLAQLAYILGFDNSRLRELRNRDTYVQQARRQLIQESESNLCVYEDLESSVHKLAEVRRSIAETGIRREIKIDLLSNSGSEAIERRSGIPFYKAYAAYRSSLFLDTTRIKIATSERKDITPVFVRRMVFNYFFTDILRNEGLRSLEEECESSDVIQCQDGEYTEARPKSGLSGPSGNVCLYTIHIETSLRANSYNIHKFATTEAAVKFASLYRNLCAYNSQWRQINAVDRIRETLEKDYSIYLKTP